MTETPNTRLTRNRCAHVPEGWSVATEVRHVSVSSAELNTVTELCPLCSGAVIGLLLQLEHHGVQTPEGRGMRAQAETIDVLRAMLEARDAQLAFVRSFLTKRDD